MDNKTNKLIPYYVEMENIIARLGELAKLDYPHKRTYRSPDGNWVTENVPEYLEEQSLITRWNELNNYERALAPGYCRNRLLVSLRLKFATGRPEFDPALAARIAVSVYENTPLIYLKGDFYEQHNK
jgi:hypothetical protein